MSDPVVEELLEKGARALAELLGVTPDETDMPETLECVGAVLDAVFPGWREGITREFGLREAGLDHVEGLPTFRIAENEARMLNRQRDLPIYVVSSLTVRSAWVPVMEFVAARVEQDVQRQIAEDIEAEAAEWETQPPPADEPEARPYWVAHHQGLVAAARLARGE